MQAQIGERLLIHGKKVGTADLVAEIVEVKGKNGGPPYLVRYPDGHETLMYPGPDCVVEHAE
ncbi:MAG: DUF1918 domain-containing protein [Nocardioidaceae bacterium]|nr:DUF1918 domain-containing protein [Nocardioidaceae bacterium]